MLSESELCEAYSEMDFYMQEINKNQSIPVSESTDFRPEKSIDYMKIEEVFKDEGFQPIDSNKLLGSYTSKLYYVELNEFINVKIYSNRIQIFYKPNQRGQKVSFETFEKCIRAIEKETSIARILERET